MPADLTRSGPRRSGSRAARGGRGPARAGVHPRRRRHRQDPGGHPPDRLPGPRWAGRAAARARGDLHDPRGRRAPVAAARPRRRGRAGADLPLRGAAPAAVLLAADLARPAADAGREQARRDPRGGRDVPAVGLRCPSSATSRRRSSGRRRRWSSPTTTPPGLEPANRLPPLAARRRARRCSRRTSRSTPIAGSSTSRTCCC